MTVRSLGQANVPVVQRLAAVLAQLDRIVVGKPEPLKLALACLLARGPSADRGHPRRRQVDAGAGAGGDPAASSTRASSSRATSFRPTCSACRSSTRQSQAFRFHPGPVFNSVVLADEINRAPPKTQSALLEAMEERQVSQDGETRPLPEPFFVIATQNPVEQIGAYPLPESQLDRFLMAIELGYPDPAAERELLTGGDRRAQIATLPAACRSADAARMAARGRRRPRRAGAARLRPGAARRHARQRRQRRRRRRAARAVAARRPAAARRGARVGAARRPADGGARGRAGGLPVRRRAPARRRRAQRRAAGAVAAARRRDALGAHRA